MSDDTRERFLRIRSDYARELNAEGQPMAWIADALNVDLGQVLLFIEGSGTELPPVAHQPTADRLGIAWRKYRALFGDDPHGTPAQLAALLELMP